MKLPKHLFLFGLALVLNCKLVTAAPLGGLWEVKNPWCPTKPSEAAKQCNRKHNDAFSIRLKVNGTKLCGTHTSLARNGGKIDAFGGDEITIVGLINKGKASVRFVSSFGAKGTATIEQKDGLLYWQINSQEAGESWIPDSAILKRNRHDRWGAYLDCNKQPVEPL
jgi:hypothetical protein